jgi:hypothetical protein
MNENEQYAVNLPFQRIPENASDSGFGPAPRPDTNHILNLVETGYASVRWASRELGWTDEDVQLAVWGEVRQ